MVQGQYFDLVSLGVSDFRYFFIKSLIEFIIVVNFQYYLMVYYNFILNLLFPFISIDFNFSHWFILLHFLVKYSLTSHHFQLLNLINIFFHFKKYLYFNYYFVYQNGCLYSHSHFHFHCHFHCYNFD